MKRFNDTYRIPSARLPNYDYNAPGWYFVTICTKGRACFFGSVRNGVMGLTREGCIVAEEWQETPAVRPYVHLDAWIIMPNHLHGIIGISSESPAVQGPQNTSLNPHSLGAIIGQIKSICTKRIRMKVARDFGWQSRFYDRVLRNEREIESARRYIFDNPAQWTRDQNHPANPHP